MAQPALDFFKRRAVIGKIETTEGTDSVPTALANGLVLMNGRSGTEFDKIERQIDRAHFTNNPFVVGNKRAFIEGEFELFPPATPGTDLSHNDVLLQVAGMESAFAAGTAGLDPATTIYTPISTAIKSASFYWWHVNVHKKILGARANISRLAMAVGNRFMGQVRVQGDYTAVTTDSLPSVTTDDTVPTVIRYDNTKTYIDKDAGVTANQRVRAAKVSAAGTGYAVNDVLTVTGGTSTTAATLTVTAISAGAVTAVSISEPGVYSVTPSSPVAVTGGGGTGATFNLRFEEVQLEVWAKELSLDFGNSLATKEYTSKKVNAISDRLATWSLRMSRTDLADFNPWTIRDAGTQIRVRMRQEEADTRFTEFLVRGQIEQIEEVDIDGDYGWQLSGPCVASDAGNDEFKITFGDDI